MATLTRCIMLHTVVVMTPTVMKELATAVKRFVTDKAAQDQIKDEWIEVLRRHLV